MNSIITEIFYSENITLVTIEKLPSDSGAIAVVLGEIAKECINVDMISQSPPQGGTISLSFTLSDNDLSKTLIILGRLRGTYPDLSTGVSATNLKLSFVSKDMHYTPGVGAQVFSMLAELGSHFKLITTSTNDISVLVDSTSAATVLESVKNAFEVTPEKIEV